MNSLIHKKRAPIMLDGYYVHVRTYCGSSEPRDRTTDADDLVTCIPCLTEVTFELDTKIQRVFARISRLREIAKGGD